VKKHGDLQREVIGKNKISRGTGGQKGLEKRIQGRAASGGLGKARHNLEEKNGKTQKVRGVKREEWPASFLGGIRSERAATSVPEVGYHNVLGKGAAQGRRGIDIRFGGGGGAIPPVNESKV